METKLKKIKEEVYLNCQVKNTHKWEMCSDFLAFPLGETCFSEKMY